MQKKLKAFGTPFIIVMSPKKQVDFLELNQNIHLIYKVEQRNICEILLYLLCIYRILFRLQFMKKKDKKNPLFLSTFKYKYKEEKFL